MYADKDIARLNWLIRMLQASGCRIQFAYVVKDGHIAMDFEDWDGRIVRIFW